MCVCVCVCVCVMCMVVLRLLSLCPSVKHVFSALCHAPGVCLIQVWPSLPLLASTHTHTHTHTHIHTNTYKHIQTHTKTQTHTVTHTQTHTHSHTGTSTDMAHFLYYPSYLSVAVTLTAIMKTVK